MPQVEGLGTEFQTRACSPAALWVRGGRMLGRRGALGVTCSAALASFWPGLGRWS